MIYGSCSSDSGSESGSGGGDNEMITVIMLHHINLGYEGWMLTADLNSIKTNNFINYITTTLFKCIMICITRI